MLKISRMKYQMWEKVRSVFPVVTFKTLNDAVRKGMRAK